jgi:hypothetical protein
MFYILLGAVCLIASWHAQRRYKKGYDQGVKEGMKEAVMISTPVIFDLSASNNKLRQEISELRGEEESSKAKILDFPFTVSNKE